MTNIKATIVADSLSPQGHRITSMILEYPRIIHSEFMTHRLFSRNAASSRAVPFKTMVEEVENNPFIPIAWQKEILYICRKIKLCTSTKQQIY